MIYLIKSNKYIKVGYSKNLQSFKQRLEDYNTHNPCYEVLDIADSGTLEDEKQLHVLLSKYHYKLEWFKYNKSVLKLWNDYTCNLKNKEEDKKKIIFDKSDIKNKVISEFGRSGIISGNDLKEKLKIIHKSFGKGNYITLKDFEKYGYSYTHELRMINGKNKKMIIYQLD